MAPSTLTGALPGCSAIDLWDTAIACEMPRNASADATVLGHGRPSA